MSTEREVHRDGGDGREHPDVDALSSELDWPAIQILRRLDGADAPVTTTEIREATGLGNQRVKYRRERLHELGLINVGDAEECPDHYPHPPKVHELTTKGRKAIAEGLVAAAPAPVPKDFDDLSALAQTLHKNLRAMEHDIDRLDDSIEDRRMEMQGNRDAIKQVAERVEELVERVGDLEASVAENRD